MNEKRCDLCLDIVTHITSIFAPDVDSVTFFFKLQQCIPHLMHKDDNFVPTTVCNDCLDELRISYHFGQKCLQAYNTHTNRHTNPPTEDAPSTNPIDTVVDIKPAVEDLVQCTYCDKYFTTLTHQEHHIRAVHPNAICHPEEKYTCAGGKRAPLYRCGKCRKVFRKRSSYSLHTHQQATYRCRYMGRGRYRRPIRSVHQSAMRMRERCELCDLTFGTRTQLEAHIQVHTHVVDVAPPTMSATPQFDDDHAPKVREGKKLHQCMFCEFKSVRRAHCVEHMRVHTGEQPYKCETCGRGFSTRGNLLRHVRTHTGEEPYQCTLCEYQCRQSNQLKQHMWKHSGIKPFLCDHCDKAFVTRAQLVAHVRTHTGERPFQCDVCGKSFAQRSTLDSHKYLHFGGDGGGGSGARGGVAHASTSFRKSTSYQCYICGVVCKRQSNLNVHMRIHTGERPYECGVCGRRFNHLSNLNRHKQIHMEVKLSLS